MSRNRYLNRGVYGYQDTASAVPAVFLQNNANLTFAVPTDVKVLDWQVEVYDDFASHDLVTNPSRITIPVNSGIVRAEFGFVLDTQSAAAAQLWTIELMKNGAFFSQLGQFNYAAGLYGVSSFNSAPYPVVEGDYYEIRLGFSSSVFQGTLVAGTTNNATSFWAKFYD